MNAMTSPIKLLWIDLSSVEQSARPEPLLQDYFAVSCCSRRDSIARCVAETDPDVICFNFDYPDRAGSRLVTEIKSLYMSTPMFITTVQHSEELAVWAFRNRMTDFLVKPVAEDELLRCYSVLKEICDAKRKQGARIIPRAMAAAPLPASIVSNVGAHDVSLEAALYFVEQHFREKIRAEEVAKLCGMSSFRFSRSFKEKYGIAFRDYVVRYRLRQAHKMISEQNSSVTEAAYAVGFNDISYFGRMFKRHFDVAPSELTSVLPDANGDFSITSILKLPLH
jgi:AraC-like DNA-binding protein/CheY-like chemotaxis protein